MDYTTNQVLNSRVIMHIFKHGIMTRKLSHGVWWHNKAKTLPATLAPCADSSQCVSSIYPHPLVFSLSPPCSVSVETSSFLFRHGTSACSAVSWRSSALVACPAHLTVPEAHCLLDPPRFHSRHCQFFLVLQLLRIANSRYVMIHFIFL